MKKIFSFALSAVALVALVGCNGQQPDPSKPTDPDVTITVNPKSLTMKINDQERLRATVTPEGTTLTLKWESSNPAVASVTSSGLVTAVAEGTANIIVSAEGIKGDTCVVTVGSEEDAFAWAGYTIWNLDKSKRLSTDTFEVALQGGLTVHCFTVSSSYWLWSDGLVFTGETLAGAGYLAIMSDVPTWIITEALDDNGPDYYYVGTNMEIVPFNEYDPTKAANACTAPAGKLASLDQHILWFNDESEEGVEEPGILGTTVYYADFDNSKFYPFEALLGEGLYDGDESVAYYKSNVAWSDGAYGLAVNEDGSALKEPYEFAKYTNHYYENLPAAEEAPRMMAPVQRVSNPVLDKIMAQKDLERFYIR